MFDILYTLGQLLTVLALAYGVFLIARSPRTFSQALELAAHARSNHYAVIGHQQLERVEAPTRGRLRRDEGPHASGNLTGLGGAAA